MMLDEKKLMAMKAALNDLLAMADELDGATLKQAGAPPPEAPEGEPGEADAPMEPDADDTGDDDKKKLLLLAARGGR